MTEVLTWQTDLDCDIVTIAEVRESENGYVIKRCDGWSCGISKESGVVPKVGDELRAYSKRDTFMRGLVIAGQVVFYRTPEEQHQLNIVDSAKRILEKKAKFEADKERLDRDYDSLPVCFKKRIDKFRFNNPDFRWEYESYEMSCCIDAVKIAKACKTPEAVKDFQKLSWPEQLVMVPDLYDGHSGNSFGMAVYLAYLYLTDEQNVIKLHGSLSVLVGSKEYGDVEKS